MSEQRHEHNTLIQGAKATSIIYLWSHDDLEKPQESLQEHQAHLTVLESMWSLQHLMVVTSSEVYEGYLNTRRTFVNWARSMESMFEYLSTDLGAPLPYGLVRFGRDLVGFLLQEDRLDDWSPDVVRQMYQNSVTVLMDTDLVRTFAEEVTESTRVLNIMDHTYTATPEQRKRLDFSRDRLQKIIQSNYTRSEFQGMYMDSLALYSEHLRAVQDVLDQ